MSNPQPLEWFFAGIGDKIEALVKREIDASFPPESVHRRIACIQAGKAMIIRGASFFGVGLGIEDHRDVLPQFGQLFDEFKAKAEALIEHYEQQHSQPRPE